MQKLHSPEDAAQWLRTRVTGVLTSDSRQLHAGDGFIAWPGAAVDARQFAKTALEQGAMACLIEEDGADAFGLSGDAFACYPGLKADTGPIAAAFYQQPSQDLSVVAITGTNGKTSTAWWLAQALSNLPAQWALPCGVIGTLGVGSPPHVVPTGLTTPDPVLLQKTLRQFVDSGLKACAIEASSIGVMENRLDGTHIRVAVFTNFTQDHLDYHGSMEAYWNAKRRVFQWAGLQSAVVNIDDAQGALLADQLRGLLEVWTVSIRQTARLQARNIRYESQGLRFEVVEGDESLVLVSCMIGSYNVSNLLGILGAMRALGVPLVHAVQACSELQPVPGRMECVGGSNQPLVAVDYAHTPDALEQALKALRPLSEQRQGALWCVFGCGGDRDAAKRPMMGAIAARYADRVVVTSDNPRSERPESIIAQILLGMPKSDAVAVQVGRAQAIMDSVSSAAAQDVILLAGKGHEAEQEIAGIKSAFSDRTHAEQALNARMSPMMTLQQAAQWMSGARLIGDGALPVQRVHTDTRTIEPGDLFVALKGEHFDANAFLSEAQQRGAVAAVCHADLDASRLPAGLPRVEVTDTTAALQALASGWRAQFELPLIAVTGSNGKTTVTQMLASILDAQCPDGTSLATRGNFNNDIGVPLTLLRLRATHRMAVVELGMNHPGEIAVLAGMARPTVALVNNAQREHLEFMQTVRAVAAENGSVISALGPQGIAVIPADDEFAAMWQDMALPRRVVRFALDMPKADDVLVCTQVHWSHGGWQVQAQGLGVTLNYRLNIAGRHNVKNSLAAAACALAAGVTPQAVERGLQNFVPVKGRSRAMQVAVQGRERTVVDDTYNANPDSVRAAIDVLAELPGPRMLVLGDMGEVGHEGPAFHAEAGRYAHAKGIEQLLALGELARSASDVFPGARHFDSVEDLNVAVHAGLPHAGSMLVKGSRFMRMERVVESVVAHFSNGER